MDIRLAVARALSGKINTKRLDALETSSFLYYPCHNTPMTPVIGLVKSRTGRRGQESGDGGGVGYAGDGERVFALKVAYGTFCLASEYAVRADRVKAREKPALQKGHACAAVAAL